METTIIPTPTPKPQWPKTLIALVGPSGCGKSTSFRNVDPTRTVILDAERKGMPFRVRDEKLVIPIDSYDKLTVELNKIKKDTTKDLVVIDSITAAIDQLQVKCEMMYKGFDIWKNYNDGIQTLCTNLKSLDKTVIITGLEEIVPIQGLDGSMTTRRRLYVQGKEWANKGIESECLAVWSVYAKKEKGSDSIQYFFATQTDGVTTAKTPIFWGLPNPMENCVVKALNKIAQELAKP